jgi:hypothetical protein
VEVQKLITRHKSELVAAQEAAAAETATQLARLKQQHEVDMAALKARMIKVCGIFEPMGTSQPI